MSYKNAVLNWWWRFGGRREFWAVYEQQISQFIKENSLAPISKEAQGALVGSIAAPIENTTAAMTEMSLMMPKLIAGGIRVPHLHYKESIYVLQPDQWTKFTAPILEKLKGKLNGAKTVSFRTMMDISESLDEIV